MRAIVLAGGYATRLRPLTDQTKKELLPIGGRPIIDWIVDSIERVDEVERLYVVSNHRFAPDLAHWAESRAGVVVLDDGTSSNEDRLGAIGDIQFVIEQAGLEHDDLLVIAGDNLFDFSLANFVGFWRTKERASCVALAKVVDPRLASQYGIVSVDAEDRVLSFVEKPSEPASDLAATAAYIFHRSHVPEIAAYLDSGHPRDAPGNLIAWLYRREPVYGYRFEGSWRDIGDHDQLLEADNLMRVRQGLPARTVYSPGP